VDQQRRIEAGWWTVACAPKADLIESRVMSVNESSAGRPPVIRVAIDQKSCRYAAMVCGDGLRVERSITNSSNQAGTAWRASSPLDVRSDREGRFGLIKLVPQNDGYSPLSIEACLSQLLAAGIAYTIRHSDVLIMCGEMGKVRGSGRLRPNSGRSAWARHPCGCIWDSDCPSLSLSRGFGRPEAGGNARTRASVTAGGALSEGCGRGAKTDSSQMVADNSQVVADRTTMRPAVPSSPSSLFCR
jgi:hypothetical protein